MIRVPPVQKTAAERFSTYFHAVAVLRVALDAVRRVPQKLHVQLDAALALLPLLLGQLRGRGAGHVDGPQRVLVDALARRAEARVAEVDLARLAVVAVSCEDIRVALAAAGHELGRVGRVQVVENHHAGVLGAPQLVELVVVALAQVEEGLPRVEVLALLDVVHVLRVVAQLRREAVAARNQQAFRGRRRSAGTLIRYRLGLCASIRVHVASLRAILHFDDSFRWRVAV